MNTRESWRYTLFGDNRWWQAFLTWVSGMPLKGQKEWLVFTYPITTHMVGNLLLWLVFLTIVLANTAVWSWILFLLASMHFMHVATLGYEHHLIAHKQAKNTTFLKPCYRLIQGLVLPFPVLPKEHGTHHGFPLVDSKDKESKLRHCNYFLWRKGDPVWLLYVKTIFAAVNPVTQGIVFFERIAYAVRKALFPLCMFWGLLLFTHGVSALWIVGLPIVLAQYSTAIFMLADHDYAQPVASDNQTLAMWRRSSAILNGKAYPVNGNIFQKAEWHITLIIWCVPIKVIFLPVDDSAHDYHHWKPNTTQFWRAAHARFEMVSEGQFEVHIWGPLHAVHNKIVSFSRKNPTLPYSE